MSQRPVVSAVVKVPGLRRYVFSNANGRFVFTGFPEGTWEIVVEALGYNAIDGSVTVADGSGLVLRLQPDPIALESLQVLSRAEGLLRQRRIRYPFRVATITPNMIAESINPDVSAIFRRNAGSFITACEGMMGEWVLGGCYYRRGQLRQVTVFLDGGELLGKMGELSRYPMEDIHSMDWLRDTGELHVYTKWFVNRLNTSRTSLPPFRWPTLG